MGCGEDTGRSSSVWRCTLKTCMLVGFGQGQAGAATELQSRGAGRAMWAPGMG